MDDLAKSGAMIAMAAGIFFGSPKDAHKHTIEYGDQASRNIKIMTTDICRRENEFVMSDTSSSI